MHGTAAWMAPEMIDQKSYHASVDLWSLGCTVIEMKTGSRPWATGEKINKHDSWRLMYYIVNSGEIPQIPNNIGPHGKDFLTKCLQRDPKSRPSAESLQKHPFLSTTLKIGKEEGQKDIQVFKDLEIGKIDCLPLHFINPSS